jgi:hypothetical protein
MPVHLHRWASSGKCPEDIRLSALAALDGTLHAARRHALDSALHTTRRHLLDGALHAARWHGLGNSGDSDHFDGKVGLGDDWW